MCSAACVLLRDVHAKLDTCCRLPFSENWLSTSFPDLSLPSLKAVVRASARHRTRNRWSAAWGSLFARVVLPRLRSFWISFSSSSPRRFTSLSQPNFTIWLKQQSNIHADVFTGWLTSLGGWEVERDWEREWGTQGVARLRACGCGYVCVCVCARMWMQWAGRDRVRYVMHD